MTLAKTVYARTAVGSKGSFECGHGLTVGPIRNDQFGGYERFAAEVVELQRMATHGLVRIDSMRHESGTGRRFIDHVIFTRLK